VDYAQHPLHSTAADRGNLGAGNASVDETQLNLDDTFDLGYSGRMRWPNTCHRSY
jgi:hypothetical protein